jgi:hypothetical protein
MTEVREPAGPRGCDTVVFCADKISTCAIVNYRFRYRSVATVFIEVMAKRNANAKQREPEK